MPQYPIVTNRPVTYELATFLGVAFTWGNAYSAHRFNIKTGEWEIRDINNENTCWRPDPFEPFTLEDLETLTANGEYHIVQVLFDDEEPC